MTNLQRHFNRLVESGISMPEAMVEAKILDLQDEHDTSDYDLYEELRRSAGVCEEFPNGEFPIPGFNCRGYDYDQEPEWAR